MSNKTHLDHMVDKTIADLVEQEIRIDDWKFTPANGRTFAWYEWYVLTRMVFSDYGLSGYYKVSTWTATAREPVDRDTVQALKVLKSMTPRKPPKANL